MYYFLKLIKLIAIILCLSAYGQDSTEFVQNEEIKFVGTPHFSMEEYLERSSNFNDINVYDSAIYYLKGAEEVAKSIHDVRALGEINYKIGNIYYAQSNFDLAQSHFQSSVMYYQLIPDTLGLAGSYNRLGVSYKYSGNFSESLNALNIALKLYMTAEDSLGIANVKLNVGNVFKNIGKSDKAINAYHEALQIFKKYNRQRSVANCYNNLGNLYKNEDQYDSAFFYMYQTLQIREQTNDEQGLSFIHHNLANLHLKSGELDSALYYISRSYIYKTGVNDKMGQATDMEVYGEIYMKKNEWRKAVLHLETALKLLEEIDNLEFKHGILVDLAICYKNLGDFKSSTNAFYEAKIIKDSLDKRNSHTLFEGELVEYELLSDSIQKAHLLLEQDLQNAKNENDELANKVLKRNIFLLIITILFVLIFFSFMIIRYQRNLYRTTERHKKLARSSVPKEEKVILLKEVHHRVKNNFQIINSLIRIQSGYMDENNFREKLKALETRIRSMSLIHEKLYKNDSISKLNVKEYLSELKAYILESYETDTEIEFDLDVEEQMYDIDSLIPLGLIMNETISNSIKHAFNGNRSGKISVKMYSDDKFTYLFIDDNGKGSGKSMDQLKHESLGMELITDLTEQLDGKLTFSSQNGFSYHFIFPRLK